MWLMILPEFRTDSAAPALLSLLPIIIGSTGYLFFAAAQRKKWATATLFSIVIIGLTLNFRNREPGDIGPDWQNGLKAFMWVALTGLGLIRWRELLTIVGQPVPALLLAHACIALASALWSPVPLYTAASAIGLFAYLSLAGLLAIDLDTNQTLKILLWSLFAFLILGVIGAIITPDLTWLSPSVEESSYRLQGFAGHPNNLGHYAGLFLVAVFVSFNRKLISRQVFVGLILFAAFILFETGSRTICVALLLTLTAISLRQFRFGGHLVLGTTAVATLVLGAIALGGAPELFDIVKQFSRTGSDAELLTLTGRTDLWSIALERIAERPLFGWGFNGTEEMMTASVSHSFYGSSVNAHNMYLQVVMSLGFIGAIPMLAILGILMYRFIISPDWIRDAFILICLINGMAEAEIFATPALSLLLTFWLVTRDATQRPLELVP